MLHKNGKVKGVVGKFEEKKALSNETSTNLSVAQTDKREAMQWATSQTNEPAFEFNLAPSKFSNNPERIEGGPIKRRVGNKKIGP